MSFNCPTDSTITTRRDFPSGSRHGRPASRQGRDPCPSRGRPSAPETASLEDDCRARDRYRSDPASRAGELDRANRSAAFSNTGSSTWRSLRPRRAGARAGRRRGRGALVDCTSSASGEASVLVRGTGRGTPAGPGAESALSSGHHQIAPTIAARRIEGGGEIVIRRSISCGSGRGAEGGMEPRAFGSLPLDVLGVDPRRVSVAVARVSLRLHGGLRRLDGGSGATGSGLNSPIQSSVCR